MEARKLASGALVDQTGIWDIHIDRYHEQCCDGPSISSGGRCHITGRKIRAGDVWELEHVKPLSMGGEHRESNLRPALASAHREKTAAEAGERAKADRIRAKHLGIFPKSKRPLKSRGFEPSRR